MEIDKSPTLIRYKNTMKQCLSLYYPQLSESDKEYLIDKSIEKRFKDNPASIVNSYTKKEYEKTLLKMSDFIMKREPLVTALGVLFRKHAESPNPMFDVIQSFLDNRSAHKKIMFKYPKGSEDFEHYNLLQTLDKIDANGTYGVICSLYKVIYIIHKMLNAKKRSRILFTTT